MMKPLEILLIALLASAVIWALIQIKNGNTGGCGGSCSGCPNSSNCRYKGRQKINK